MPHNFLKGRSFATIIRTAISIFQGAIAFVLMSVNAYASPWVDPGDERVKHHLNLLNDSGVARILTTSWPLNWSDIKASLDAVDPRQLDEQSLWSYRFLLHEVRKATKTSISRHSLSVSSAPSGIGYFGTDFRDSIEASGGLEFVGERLAFNIKGTYAHDPIDGRESRADGSFISYLAGNWALGFGLVDRWWGPGWESSLILSNSARPVPALFLQRHHAKPFESRWLSWLGPWQLTTFMGELEENRHVPDANLWGLRVNFKPLPQLEIGLSRTAQWGGDGRPRDANTFFNLLIGKDNRGDSLAIDDEPGNQLAGFDARWGFSTGGLKSAVYAQLIGEDEAGGLPSRHIGMAGAETAFHWLDTQLRVSFEAQNSTVYFYDRAEAQGGSIKRPAYNVAYEHTIYASGYRYLGRPLGASSDNDSEILTARLQAYLRNGHHAVLSVAHNRINTDGTNRQIGGNVFGDQAITNDSVTFEYNAPITDTYLIQIGLFHHSQPLFLAGEEIDSGGFIRLQGMW